jgi:hypothetical protein
MRMCIPGIAPAVASLSLAMLVPPGISHEKKKNQPPENE